MLKNQKKSDFFHHFLLAFLYEILTLLPALPEKVGDPYLLLFKEHKSCRGYRKQTLNSSFPFRFGMMRNLLIL